MLGSEGPRLMRAGSTRSVVVVALRALVTLRWFPAVPPLADPWAPYRETAWWRWNRVGLSSRDASRASPASWLLETLV